MRNFRVDIEGLRALAVLLVMFYHYRFPGISGGFVGVDVFFVISGFVITQLLERHISAGTFSFADFYARRIRRLVPVFLVVSTVSFLMISPYYLDDDYYVFAKSWLASLAGVSNLYYFAELSQYFAPEAKSLTLLHTWSLAVEEQFYLLWPAVLYLTYRLWTGSRGVWLFGAVWLAFLALSIHLTAAVPAAAFYLLPARVFELLLGAGVALYGPRLRWGGRWTGEVMALAGLALILGTALTIDGEDTFPGLNALWPTLGTALVILAGLHRQETWVARLLGLRPLVVVGGLSYSIYLWHWPPVALLQYQLVELTWPIRLGLIAGVLVLSWLSFHRVENRFRYRSWSLKKSAGLLLLLPLLAIWAIQSTIRIADDLSFRIPEEKRAIYRIIDQNNAQDHFDPCFDNDPVGFERGEVCLFGAPAVDGQPNAVLVGDSHATALMGFVEELLPGTDLSLLLVTQASTPFLPAAIARQVLADAEKIDRNRALDDYLSQRPLTVFVAAWWNSYLRNPAYHDHFLATLAWLSARGHQVVVLEDVAELPSAAHAHCLMKSVADCSIAAGAVQDQFQAFEKFKTEAAVRFPGIRWLDPRDLMCDGQRCQTVLNGIPLYRDESHLNYLGAREVGRLYRQRFGNPLLDDHP